MKSIYRSFLTEINFPGSAPGNGSQFNWIVVNELRDVWVFGCEFYWAEYVRRSPAGKNVAAVATAPGIVVSLTDKGQNQRINQMPSVDLTPPLQQGFYRDFVPFQIDLTKSFITILDNTGIGANESVICNFFYMRPEEYNKVTKG